MALLRMDNVLLVVEDLDAVIAFFSALGMEIEGRSPVEGPSVDRVIGIDVAYDDAYRLAYVRGPEGILVGLAEQLG